MTDAFWIKWTNPGSKNFVDILGSFLFAEEVSGREITHPMQSPRGDTFWARCNLQVAGNSATLIYPADERWWAGTTKIAFANNKRQTIKNVLWAEEGEEKFENLHPKFGRVVNADVQDEVERWVRMGKIAVRRQQAAFSAKVREAYGRKCAVTGCSTSEALEAAHIRVEKGVDMNDLNNGILLRADVHALFDAGLITLAENGESVQVKKELLSDATYQSLDGKRVFRPSHGPPSKANIVHHRRRFAY